MKEVLLYSGGMDSYVMAHMIPEAKLLYINSGAKYSEEELKRVHHLAPREVTVVQGAVDLSRWERSDAIVPARNLFLVAIASFYGDRVYLGSTSGDNSTDKDDRFCYLSSDLLSHIYDCDHFDRLPVEVEAPYKQWSKKDLAVWLKAQYPQAVDGMKNTLSCYEPLAYGGHCGQCKACIRKWAALQAAGIDWWPEGNNPMLLNWKPIVEKIKGPGWRSPAEDGYTMGVLQRFGVAGA